MQLLYNILNLNSNIKKKHRIVAHLLQRNS